MTNILAIVRKEWRGYFASPIGYVVLGMYAFVFGLFYTVGLNYFIRQSMAGPMGRETPLAVAAPLIAAGLLERRRRVFVPGWVRWLFVFRSALHTRPLEREQLAAARELEALYLYDLKAGLAPAVAPPPGGGAN